MKAFLNNQNQNRRHYHHRRHHHQVNYISIKWCFSFKKLWIIKLGENAAHSQHVHRRSKNDEQLQFQSIETHFQNDHLQRTITNNNESVWRGVPATRKSGIVIDIPYRFISQLFKREISTAWKLVHWYGILILSFSFSQADIHNMFTKGSLKNDWVVPI